MSTTEEKQITIPIGRQDIKKLEAVWSRLCGLQVLSEANEAEVDYQALALFIHDTVSAAGDAIAPIGTAFHDAEKAEQDGGAA